MLFQTESLGRVTYVWPTCRLARIYFIVSFIRGIRASTASLLEEQGLFVIQGHEG